MTGNLEAPVDGVPPFPGSEANYLRTQIARITAGTVVSPSECCNIYKESSVSDVKSTEENPIIKEPSKNMDALASLTAWVHRDCEINTLGRCRRFRKVSIVEGDEMTTQEIASISKDAKGTWSIQLTPVEVEGVISVTNEAVILKSLTWPGAYTIACVQNYSNIYVGEGFKHEETPYENTYIPSPMPLLEPELMEDGTESTKRDPPHDGILSDDPTIMLHERKGTWENNGAPQNSNLTIVVKDVDLRNGESEKLINMQQDGMIMECKPEDYYPKSPDVVQETVIGKHSSTEQPLSEQVKVPETHEPNGLPPSEMGQVVVNICSTDNFNPPEQVIMVGGEMGNLFTNEGKGLSVVEHSKSDDPNFLEDEQGKVTRKGALDNNFNLSYQQNIKMFEKGDITSTNELNEWSGKDPSHENPEPSDEQQHEDLSPQKYETENYSNLQSNIER